MEKYARDALKRGEIKEALIGPFWPSATPATHAGNFIIPYQKAQIKRKMVLMEVIAGNSAGLL